MNLEVDYSFRPNGLITLTTDFGVADPYVGVMKGAILARHPAAQVVDLTHHIPAFQPRLAGFWLTRVYRHFPAGTVHLAVVDPGVGTERGMVLLLVEGQLFVAPDNGSLDPVAASSGSPQWRSFTVKELAHLRLQTVSHTFHGRDIFAPLVSEISANRQPINTLGIPAERRPVSRPSQPGIGQVVWVDHYGNIITDIDATCLAAFNEPVLRFRTHLIPLHRSYGFAKQGELLGVVNSWETLEIAVAQGNAQQYLQAAPGEPVNVTESTPRTEPRA